MLSWLFWQIAHWSKYFCRRNGLQNSEKKSIFREEMYFSIYLVKYDSKDNGWGTSSK